MRFLALVLALLIFYTPVNSTPVAAAPIQVFKSVRPLTMVAVNEETGVVGLQNICTVSSINESAHLWLTAAHCVEGDVVTYIQGEPVTEVVVDTKNDIAILKTPLASAPALKLATKAPRVLDPVLVVGHPFGFVYPFMVVGTIASIYSVLDPQYPPFLIIQSAGAPGNSGSAILNNHNEIISVLQIGFGRSFSPIMGGCVFGALAQYRGYWGE